MRRSKLQLNVEILEALTLDGPMRLTRITCKANLSYTLLKSILTELLKNQRIKERTLKKNTIVYTTTNQGRTTLSKFKEPAQILPMT
jgi:predicted transcriptional regulator